MNTSTFSFLASIAVAAITFIASTPVAAQKTASVSTPGDAVRRSKSNKTEPAPEDPHVLPIDSILAPKAEDGAEESNENVHVRVSVPQMNKAVTRIVAYPFLVRPPRVRKPIDPLPEDPRMVREQIISYGYSARSALERPYPPGGWRWQYAYRAALQKKGGMEPHNLLSLYPFAHKLTPYLIAEVKRINAIEKQREARYLKLQEDFETMGSEMESEALRRGVAPVPLRLKRIDGSRTASAGVAQLAPGNWWILATHKTPGLIYHWELPITVNPGDQPTIYLTANNAVLIEGGW